MTLIAHLAPRQCCERRAAHTNAPSRTAGQPPQPQLRAQHRGRGHSGDLTETVCRENTVPAAAPQQTIYTSPPSAGLPDMTSRSDRPRRQTRIPTRFKDYAVARNLTTLWNSSCVSRHKNWGMGRTLAITRHFVIFTCSYRVGRSAGL